MSENGMRRPAVPVKSRFFARDRIALALIVPLLLLAVSGCSLARSCANGRDGDTSRGAARSTVALEGIFTATPDGRVAGERVVLTGSVVAVGSEPHVRALFVLEDGTGSYDLYPDARGREALALQGRLVEITAIFVDRALLPRSRPFSRDGVAYPLSWKIVN